MNNSTNCSKNVFMKNLEEVRNRIIESAEKHFSILGFEKTTLDDITGDNGKSKTSVYYHFKNKHEIFKSVIMKEFESVRSELQAVLDSTSGSNVDRMKAYLDMRIASVSAQGAFRRFASSRFAFGDNPVSRAVADARRPFDEWERAFFESNIRLGLEAGEIPGKISAEAFASTMLNILKALEIQFFSSGDREKYLDTYHGMIDLILR